MANVYSIEKEKNLILYSCGKFIYLRVSVADTMDRPIVLSNDFSHSLSDTIYNGTIYYSYINTNGDIVIKSIIDTNALFMLSSKDSPDCFSPHIAILDKKLLLFYFIKNPLDDTFSLKCIYPFEKGQSVQLPLSYKSLPIIKLISTNSSIVLIITDTNDDNAVAGTSPTTITASDSASNPEIITICSDNNWRRLKDEISFKQSFEEAIASEKNALSTKMTALEYERNSLVQQNNSLIAEIKKRDQLIESIKSQYNELMQTAIKYRDEANKWHGKFYKKQ